MQCTSISVVRSLKMKEILGNIASPKGFSADGIHTGIKKENWI